MAADKAINLLLVTPSEDEAEQISSQLRNAGMAVRPKRVQEMDELLKQLEDGSNDLLVFDPRSEDFTLSYLTGQITRLGKDVPVLQITRHADDESRTQAMIDGAVDQVTWGAAEQLQLIFKREWESLQARRNVRRKDAALNETEKRCHSLLDSSRDAIAYIHEGMHVYANQAYLDLYDVADYAEIEGLSVLDMLSAEDPAELKALFKRLAQGEVPSDPLEATGQRMDGSTFDMRMEFSSAAIDGEPCVQMIMRERAASPELEEELSELRTRDLLTGLRNRQWVTEVVGNAITSAVESHRTTQTVLYINLDNFRELSTELGLSASDLVLTDAAKLIESVAGEGDTARYGEHSFVVMTKVIGADVLTDYGQTFCKAIEDHIFEVGKRSLSMTCSVGAREVVENAKSANEVLNQAATAAAQADAKGGNCTHIYDPLEQGKGEDAPDDSYWQALLTKALKEDKFHLNYQSIVSVHGAEGNYFEVLIRLTDPDGEEVMPSKFLPAAERTGLTPAVDRWVTLHAFKKLATENRRGQDVTFFIKIDPRTAADRSFLPWIAKQLKALRLTGAKAVFEMPESRVVTNLKPVRRFVDGIRQLHCRFALEQFGSGVNSFQVLKHIEAEFLKLDRSFMVDLPDTPEHVDKIKELNNQAHAQGKLTIAEFVEDASSMSILWQTGVNFVQGNFLHRPEPELTYDLPS